MHDSLAAGGGDFATASAVDHRLCQPGFALECSAIMHPGRLDDLAAAAENFVTELEDAQIRPGPWAQSYDLPQQLVCRPVRARLRHHQGRRSRRAGYPRMAVDEEVRLLGQDEVAREGKEQLDVPALGGDPPRLRFDHVMEAQPQTPIDIEPAQRIRLGPAGVEDRENMRYASRAMAL